MPHQASSNLAQSSGGPGKHLLERITGVHASASAAQGPRMPKGSSVAAGGRQARCAWAQVPMGPKPRPCAATSATGAGRASACNRDARRGGRASASGSAARC